jgi:hypothetical protein
MMFISGDQSVPRALETTPPWGAESVRESCLKMRDMLLELAKTPELKVDFDLAAKDLVTFLDEFPDGRDLLAALVDRGQLGFVGNDYSQAHYQTLRSESALRQLRMGAEVYQDRLGYVTDTFMHQETSLFDNLPQLLAAFGIKKAAIHSFQTMIEFLELPALEICSNFGELEFVRQETFAKWRGLDGSALPVYLPVVKNDAGFGWEPPPPRVHPYPTAYEENRGLYRNGAVIIQCPDLVDITPEYIETRRPTGEFWRLSEALDDELETARRMPAVRYYTYWSYAEGEFGEMMYKAFRACEAKLLAAETMQVIAQAAGLAPAPFDGWQAWEKLATAQHHDVTWLDTKEIKDRTLAGAGEAGRDAEACVQDCAARIAPSGGRGQAVTVINTLPVGRTALARVKTPDEGRQHRVFEGETEVPCQLDGDQLVFPAVSRGLGWRTFELRVADAAGPVPEILSGPYVFENDAMSVTVLPDGRIESLRSKSTGERLRAPGNLIRGRLTTSEGGRDRHRWISNEGAAQAARLERGPLYDKVSVDSRIGDIPYRLVVRLPHGAERTIGFDLELGFDGHEIGDFFHDETKLCVYWPLNHRDSEIAVDQPFGWTWERPDRPLHPSNFTAVFEGGTGLVFQHWGTPKSWVAANTYANLLAWGSNRFTNRYHRSWQEHTQFDMRLDRTCRYRYAVTVAEERDIPAIARRVSEDITPFVTALCGEAGSAAAYLRLDNPNLVVTAVEPKDGKAAVRVYDTSGEPSTLRLETDWRLAGKFDPAGNPKPGDPASLGPFEIADLHFDVR